MTKKRTNIRVDFRIMGDNFNLQDITSFLKIEPTQFWHIGDNIRNTGKKRKYTCWQYSTGYKETLDINTQLRKIEKIFIEKTNLLIRLKEDYALDYSIDIVIKIENREVPAIYLESPIIQFASNIGARFDIDTYVN